MERLLRDGGDLDSMDRSLLDYNASAVGAANGKATMSNGSITSPTQPRSPPLLLNVNGDGGGSGNEAAMTAPPPPYDEGGGSSDTLVDAAAAASSASHAPHGQEWISLSFTLFSYPLFTHSHLPHKRAHFGLHSEILAADTVIRY